MSMKKKMLILFISSTILLSGCQKDPLSEQVSQEISQLENVTLDDEDTVTELENTYENMTDKQKNQVKNYTALREARKKIDKLKYVQENTSEILEDPAYSEAVEACEKVEETIPAATNIRIQDITIYEDSDEYSHYVRINMLYDTENKHDVALNTISTFFAETYSLTYVEGDKHNGYEALNQYFTLPKQKERTRQLDLDIIEYFLE